MNIDIDTYRSRIGRFRTPNQKRFKPCFYSSKTDTSIRKWKSVLPYFLGITLISAFCVIVLYQSSPPVTAFSALCHQYFKFNNLSVWEAIKVKVLSNCSQADNVIQKTAFSVDHNFNARYLNGNRRNGMKLIHWNKGSSLLENRNNSGWI